MGPARLTLYTLQLQSEGIIHEYESSYSRITKWQQSSHKYRTVISTSQAYLAWARDNSIRVGYLDGRSLHGTRGLFMSVSQADIQYEDRAILMLRNCKLHALWLKKTANELSNRPPKLYRNIYTPLLRGYHTHWQEGARFPCYVRGCRREGTANC